jgi:hypothetical protein
LRIIRGERLVGFEGAAAHPFLCTVPDPKSDTHRVVASKIGTILGLLLPDRRTAMIGAKSLLRPEIHPVMNELITTSTLNAQKQTIPPRRGGIGTNEGCRLFG